MLAGAGAGAGAGDERSPERTLHCYRCGWSRPWSEVAGWTHVERATHPAAGGISMQYYCARCAERCSVSDPDPGPGDRAPCQTRGAPALC